MKHLRGLPRLLLRFVTGFLWAVLIGVVSGYLILNEQYLSAFDEWRK